MAESSGPRGYPGQRLQDEKKVLEGQVFHKRSCGNKLLFLQLGPSPTLGSTTLNVSCPEAIFSFDVYGSEVRDVRKDISVGDVVQCTGTWRDCGTILDVFSYSIQSRWVDVSGGASFQAPEAKIKQHQPGRSSNVVKDDLATDAKDEVEAPPAPFDSTSHRQRRNLCKFWMSNGTCIKSQCNGFHPEGDELKEARLRWRQEQSRRLASNAQADDPHGDKEKKGHSHRAAVFADWLCEAYGIETLRKGVLDVAGGRGELAFELSVKRQIPCTVLDPRCPGGMSPAPWTSWHVSRQQRLWFKTCLGIRSYVECQEYVAKCPLKQCQIGVEEAIEIAAARNQRNTCDTVNTVIRADWEDVLNCKVVVGLHPDQATGGILDLAKVLSCPFAVVPCCTFADDFPERRLGDRPVRTYDDLVEWLLATDTAEKGFLMFFGKNLVVFTKSPST